MVLQTHHMLNGACPPARARLSSLLRAYYATAQGEFPNCFWCFGRRQCRVVRQDLVANMSHVLVQVDPRRTLFGLPRGPCSLYQAA